MFTGIIQTLGTLKRRSLSGKHGTLAILPQKRIDAPVLGESIAVNGTCLTLTAVDNNGELTFDTLAITLEKTNLGTLPIGSEVNLERALRAEDRLGGHFVQGHIDTTAKVIAMGKKEDDIVLTIACPDALHPLIILTGSISINGVSLTVAERDAKTFAVHLIPTTLKDTALRHLKPGDSVNLEGDILGKYIVHLTTQKQTQSSTVTLKKLIDSGF